MGPLDLCKSGVITFIRIKSDCIQLLVCIESRDHFVEIIAKWEIACKAQAVIQRPTKWYVVVANFRCRTTH